MFKWLKDKWQKYRGWWINTVLIVLTNIWIAYFSLRKPIKANEIGPVFEIILIGIILLLGWSYFGEGTYKDHPIKQMLQGKSRELFKPGYTDDDVFSSYISKVCALLFVILLILPLFIKQMNVLIVYAIALPFFMIGCKKYNNPFLNSVFGPFWYNFACPILAYIACIFSITTYVKITGTPLPKEYASTVKDFIWSFGNVLVNAIYIASVPAWIYLTMATALTVKGILKKFSKQDKREKEKKRHGKNIKKENTYTGGRITPFALLRQKEIQHLCKHIFKICSFALLLISFVLFLATVIVLATEYRWGDWMHIVSLLCESTTPIDDFEKIICLIGKIIIWGFIIPLTFAMAMIPINPIYFAGAAVIRKKKIPDRQAEPKYEIAFRYWIMKRKAEFLHDVSLTAYLQDKSNINLEETPEPEYLWHQKINLARGIRQWSCDIEKKELLELIYKKRATSDYCFIFRIDAYDDHGHRFSKINRYTFSNIIFGADFAKIHEYEWEKNIEPRQGKIDKYQNFEKVRELETIYLDNKKKIKLSNENQKKNCRGYKIVGKDEEQNPDKLLIRIVNRLCKHYSGVRRFSAIIKRKIIKIYA